MIIYLSGPISLNGTLPPHMIEENKQRFDEAATRLRGYGYQVISPVELPKQDSWEDYMRLCIAEVLKADLVYVLPHWGRSRGSVFEVLVAQTVGTPVENYEIDR